MSLFHSFLLRVLKLHIVSPTSNPTAILIHLPAPSQNHLPITPGVR
ncbi:hypothetical protein X975_02261, partial [Stegodyphus mimosarum]